MLAARDIRFAEPVIPGFRLSSPEAPDFILSSTELMEARDLCAGVVEVLVVGGRRGVELTVGRVGGLFKLPFRDALLDVVAAGFVTVGGLEVVGRLDVVEGRFGGTVVLVCGGLFLASALDMGGTAVSAELDAPTADSIAGVSPILAILTDL